MAEYPLAAALTLRSQELDEAKANLAQARRAEAHQEERLALAGAAVQRKDSEIAAARSEQRQRGAAQAAELLRGVSYDASLRTERDRLVAEREKEEAQLREARAQVEAQMAKLATARAEHEAVIKHREKWLREKAVVQERRAEAEVDDQNATRFGSERKLGDDPPT